VALRGASGAKDAAHILGGLDTPATGDVEFADCASALSAGALTAFRNHEVGFVFQATSSAPDLGDENVCLPARMARVAA
jgi:predicted ABC-type transport system involved in lysophospholipase L1 biosynthesis ATPase subunit